MLTPGSHSLIQIMSNLSIINVVFSVTNSITLDRDLELWVHIQIGVGFRVIGGFSHMASFGGFSW